MHLRLEHRQTTLHTLDAADIGPEGLTIGRGASCTWRTPPDDPGVSTEHLRVFSRGKTLWIEDLQSTNGLFLRGKRVQKHRLEIGDQFSFGNACLSVEPDPSSHANGGPSWLLLSSPQAGKRKILLDKPVLSIGSSPDADLRFPSELVSQKHAEIRRQADGGCWLVDLNSKNGTRVNDVSLPSDKERLLKEQDRIAISQFEFVYFDGSLARPSSRIGVKIAVVAAAISLSWVGHRAWQQLTPAAADFVHRAEAHAERGDFQGALDQLSRAVGGRGYRDMELTLSSLRRSVLEWKAVSEAWNSSLSLLTQKKWVEASRLLAGIANKGKDAWSWNAEAPALREQALDARRHLDNLLIAKNAATRDSVDPAYLAEVLGNGTASLSVLGDVPPPYLDGLRDELSQALDRLTSLLEGQQSLETSLKRLVDESPPPVTEVLASLTSLQKDASGAVRRRLEAVLPPLTQLRDSHTLITEALQNLYRLNLEAATSLDPALPSVDSCAIDPSISQLRANLQSMAENLVNSTIELRTLLTRMGPGLPLDGSPAPVFLELSDTAKLEKVLACDALDVPMPRRTREAPTSAYDAFLGVEEFQLRLQTLPDRFEPELLGGAPRFVPVLRRMEELCRHVERFLAYLEEPRNASWLPFGDILTAQQSAQRLLERRDQLLREWRRRIPDASSRQRVLLGGMIAALSPTLDLQGVPAAEWTRDQFRDLRAEVLSLHRRYLESSPEEQIRQRVVLLRTGLPGDGILRPLWSALDDVRAP